MRSHKEAAFFPILLIILSMISLVSGASLAKRLFLAIGAESTSAIRLGVAAFFLILVWRPWRFGVSKSQLKQMIIYGICLGFMNFLFYLAIARLPIGIAIAIEFMGPLAVTIYFSRRPLDFLWVLFVILGIALILPLFSTQAPIDMMGVVYVLGAAVAWACYIIQGKKASTSGHPGVVTSLGMSAGFLVVLPFGAPNIPHVFTDGSLLMTAVGVGILSSAIPYSLEMVALDKLASKHFSLLMSMEPAIGALAGFFFLSEHLTALQILGIASIITASVGSTLTTPSKGAKEGEMIIP